MVDDGNRFLEIESLVTGYGKKQVVGGVDLTIAPGEIVALIGHNGSGKSTLLKAIFGLLPIWRGRVLLEGRPIGEPAPRKWLSMGVAYVPQGNRVFGDLSVRENLEMGGVTLREKRQSGERIEEVLMLFPDLRPRLGQRAATLSGGEKQMLALATGLITQPKLLFLDEPSLGLAPTLVAQALSHVNEISQQAKVAVLIVEQKVREVLKIARRVYVLRNGQVSFTGAAETLRNESKLREVYL